MVFKSNAKGKFGLRTIPASLITEKNKPSSEHPWVTLLDIQIDDTTWLYITNYDAIYNYWRKYHDDWIGARDKIIFPHSSGSSYDFFPFKFDMTKESSSGSLHAIYAMIDNSNRLMESFLHNYDLMGNRVIMRVVNLNYMDSGDNQLIDYFTILSINSGLVVTFELGHIGMINQRFGRTITRTCGFRFKDSYCGYVGAGTSCLRILGDVFTPETCRYYANSRRFGGFPNAQGFLKE